MWVMLVSIMLCLSLCRMADSHFIVHCLCKDTGHPVYITVLNQQYCSVLSLHKEKYF